MPVNNVAKYRAGENVPFNFPAKLKQVIYISLEEEDKHLSQCSYGICILVLSLIHDLM